MFITRDITSIYKIINVLGIGSYGEVFNVIDKHDKAHALKISYFTDNILINPMILREISNLIKLKHDNIIKLKKVFISFYKDKKCICILLELCKGTLLELNNDIDINLFYQLLDTLIYINQMGFYHGDLSASNILLGNENDIILADFGFARKYYRKFDIELKPSLQVRPIELLNNDKEEIKINIKKFDLWGLGCILYLIFEKEQIIDNFIDKNINNNNIKEKYIRAIKKINDDDNISDNFKEILKMLLNFNPSERICFEKIKRINFNEKNKYNEFNMINLEKFNTKQVKNNLYNSIFPQGKKTFRLKLLIIQENQQR